MSRPASLEYETAPREPARREIALPTDLVAASLRIVATIGIALWLGSLAHLLLTVATLFAAFPKVTSPVAVEAAPVIFRASERAGLIIAAITMAAAVAWNWRTPTRSRRWIAWLLAAAAILAIAQTTLVSARMDALRAEGQSGNDTFRTLHGVSSSQYLVQTALLLAAAATLPAALRSVEGVTP